MLWGSNNRIEALKSTGVTLLTLPHMLLRQNLFVCMQNDGAAKHCTRQPTNITLEQNSHTEERVTCKQRLRNLPVLHVGLVDEVDNDDERGKDDVARGHCLQHVRPHGDTLARVDTFLSFDCGTKKCE